MADYDVSAAFAAIENELLSSMMRNMKRHRAEETKEGFEWTQWQAEQLRALDNYKRTHKGQFQEKYSSINQKMGAAILNANATGMMRQEAKILDAIKKGFDSYSKPSDKMVGQFFRTNDRKMDALVKATTNDMNKVESAILRMHDDKYRKAIFNAQVYANSGAGTYEKAVDMAVKDYLMAGINCVKYKNGRQVNVKDYAEMALRTASKRAYLAGEGVKRQEWGIHTVIMNKRGNPCPMCLPWVGKVLIDDVWSGGTAEEAEQTGYPLMSTAMAAGLYHPNCRDSHTTYFEGISTPPDSKWKKSEVEEVQKEVTAEAKAKHAENMAEKCGRVAKYSLDAEDKRIYRERAKQWSEKTVVDRFKPAETTEQAQEYATSKTASAIQNYEDVTEKWIKEATPNSHIVEDLDEYIADGIKYKVDGKNVVLDYKPREKEVAELLEITFGGEIKMVPRVLIPQGISTPDYLFRGEKFDLKESQGMSRKNIYGMLKGKSNQANNFIIDISKSPLPYESIIQQVEDVYSENRLSYVNKIIVIKGKKIEKIYVRTKK